VGSNRTANFGAADLGDEINSVLMRTLREYIEIVEKLYQSEPVDESAPPGKKAEHWINKNKARFKAEYGDDYKSVLYGKAWNLFGRRRKK
jgi:hypothetical protein